MAESAELAHPGQVGGGPPVGVIIQNAGILLQLGVQHIAQAAHVQIFAGIKLLPPGQDVDAPLGRLRVHDDAVLVVFDHDVAVGAHPDVRCQLLVEGGGIHHQTDRPLPHRPFQHQIVGVAAVVLPVGDGVGAGEQHVAAGRNAVAAVGDVPLAVFDPDIPERIAAGQARAEVVFFGHLAGGGIQTVGVFVQRKLDAVGQALHHQLQLAGLALHEGGAVILPDKAPGEAQQSQHRNADHQRPPDGAQQPGQRSCMGCGNGHGGFSFQRAECLLFSANHVILLIVYQSTFCGKGVR